MDKPWITAELQERHNVFTGTVQALPADVLVRSKNDKWSAAQHLAHILSGVRPVTLSLAVPTWFLRWRFGKLNRAPRSYAELVARYQEKLAAGGRASGRFVPPVIAAEEVPAMVARIDRSVRNMGRSSTPPPANTSGPKAGSSEPLSPLPANADSREGESTSVVKGQETEDPSGN